MILCPYCLSPVDENTKFCPTCGEDTTRDALVEMTQEEYLNKERITCRFCGNSMLKLAPVCPSCRRWQAR
jgi:lipopolysaccharide biosynthesis regulator YciM